VSIPGCHDDIFEAFRASSQGASLHLSSCSSAPLTRNAWCGDTQVAQQMPRSGDPHREPDIDLSHDLDVEALGGPLKRLTTRLTPRGDTTQKKKKESKSTMALVITGFLVTASCCTLVMVLLMAASASPPITKIATAALRDDRVQVPALRLADENLLASCGVIESVAVTRLERPLASCTSGIEQVTLSVSAPALTRCSTLCAPMVYRTHGDMCKRVTESRSTLGSSCSHCDPRIGRKEMELAQSRSR
jgi:hypothetical protein